MRIIKVVKEPREKGNDETGREGNNSNDDIMGNVAGEPTALDLGDRNLGVIAIAFG